MANFCTNCGTPLTEGMQFCPKCGAPVFAGAPSEPAEQQPAPQTDPAPQQTEQTPPPAQQPEPRPDAQQSQPEPPAYDTSRAAIKRKAHKLFTAYYWPCVGILFLAMVMLYGLPNAPYIRALGIFIIPPLAIGRAMFCLKVYRGEKPGPEELFEPFKRYGHNLGGILWMTLFIILWSLLLVVPGIIKGFAYCFTTCLLEDYPTLPAKDALKMSMKLTKGHKMDIFVMSLSFIGWGLLCFVTAGLVMIFYAGPYFNISLAGLYDEVRKEALANGRVTEAQLKGEAPLA